MAAAALAFAIALAAGVAWDHFGSNAIQRARAVAGCSQTSQTAELEYHELPNLPTPSDPAALEPHVNIHVRFVATFKCAGSAGEPARRITVDQYDDARGAMRADGSIQLDRDIDPKDGLDPYNWPAGG